MEKTRGVVLNYTKYSDSSGILNVYTQQFGRQAYLIRGINRGRKVTRTALFRPLTILDIEASHSQKREVQTMKSCILSYIPADMQSNIAKSTITIFLAEVLTSALREEAPDTKLYDFIENSVIYLDQCENTVSNFHIMFLTKLTIFLGFGPSLPDFEEVPVFDLTNGIFCRVPPAFGEYAPQAASSLFMSFISAPFNQMSKIRLQKEERQETIDLLLKYYSLHLPGFKKINSIRVLHDLFEN
jgi:DNA repair protein RecO (recombination protein O)